MVGAQPYTQNLSRWSLTELGEDKVTAEAMRMRNEGELRSGLGLRAQGLGLRVSGLRLRV